MTRSVYTRTFRVDSIGHRRYHVHHIVTRLPPQFERHGVRYCFTGDLRTGLWHGDRHVVIRLHLSRALHWISAVPRRERNGADAVHDGDPWGAVKEVYRRIESQAQILWYAFNRVPSSGEVLHLTPCTICCLRR